MTEGLVICRETEIQGFPNLAVPPNHKHTDSLASFLGFNRSQVGGLIRKKETSKQTRGLYTVSQPHDSGLYKLLWQPRGLGGGNIEGVKEMFLDKGNLSPSDW